MLMFVDLFLSYVALIRNGHIVTDLYAIQQTLYVKHYLIFTFYKSVR